MWTKFVVLILVTIVSTESLKYYIDKATCQFTECCHPDDGTGYLFYKKGAENLLRALKTQVHGQPLIIDPIYRSILAHVSEDKPIRPLVMYFAGWTGSGKTFVSKIIADSLYKEGMKSKFVNYISSTYHFPMRIEGHKEITVQRGRLRDMIKNTVSKCGRSLIVLDELDKLPSGVVDILQPMIDYVEDVDGVSYNKAIFILLSNTGSDNLNRLAYKVYQDSKERNQISSKEVEKIIMFDSYNEKEGLRQSPILKRNSIGVFVPFLPMERAHVKLCIRDEIKRQNHRETDQEELIEQIVDEMLFFPNDTQLYSRSGCKGVRDKVINFIGPKTISYRGEL